MPELKMPRNEFVDTVVREAGFLNKDRIYNLATKYDQKIVGVGTECVVIPTENDRRETVAAFLYRGLDTFDAQDVFYTQRILSTLFPQNFPHFYAAFDGKYPQNISGTIRQKIESTHTPIIYSFESVEKISTELGLDFLYDKTRTDNLIVGKDGGEYYVDTVQDLWVEDIDIEKIVRYMTEHNFSKIDIEIVEKSIERLIEIRKGKNRTN